MNTEDLQNSTLLIVDDKLDNIDTLIALLKETSYRFQVAQNSDEVFKRIEAKKPDIILLDILMPGVDGFGVIQQLKRNDFTKDIPVIFMSALADLENKVKGFNYGAADYITKPYQKEEVLVRIQTHLKIAAMQLELKKNNEQLEAKVKERTAELEIEKEKAEQSDRLKTKFIQNLSHEIRTPMNGIIGFATLLDEKPLPHEQCKEFTNVIISSTKQLLRIIDDILEISKLETKQVKINNTKVCINELLLEIYATYKIKNKSGKLSINLNNTSDDKFSTVYIDETKLKTIVNNLMENACKFTKNGIIELGYKIKNEFIEIYVKDTGVGILPDMKEKVFERFIQENNGINEKYSGLGLGLSLVKENAVLMGGNVSLTSEKDKGSIFTVELPYNPVFEKNNKNTSNVEPISEKRITHTILIVEDEYINYLYLQQVILILNPHIHVLHAKDGIQAVEMCENYPEINLVFMDIKLPLKNGLDATREIKVFRPELVIIAQTAYSKDEDINQAILAGCSEVLVKPIDKNNILELVTKYLAL